MKDLNSLLIQGLITRGQRGNSRKIYYTFLDKWKRKAHKEDCSFDLLMNKISPRFGFVSFSKGGIKYQVPQLLKEKKSKMMALRWLLKQRRRGNNMANILYNNLIEISESRGSLVKRREDVHKLALLNQKFFRFMRLKRLKLTHLSKNKEKVRKQR